MGDLVTGDVVSFKERDLALALSHISAVVGLEPLTRREKVFLHPQCCV
jgi:hypothetical protein